MTLLQPWFLPVCLFALWPLVAERFLLAGPRAGLPGAWRQLVGPDMRALAAAQVRATHDRLGGATIALLWLVLGLALAEPVLKSQPAVSVSNLAGRVVVVDLSDPAGADAVRSMATAISARAVGMPVAVIAATGDAFDVVPFTTDRQHAARYLSVLAPALMPVAGREPHRALAHAEAMLVRAGMIGGQVVLVTSASSMPTRQSARDRWLRGIVHVGPGRNPPEDVRRLAEETHATLVTAGEAGTLDRQLDQAVASLVGDSPEISGQVPLQPWLIALAGLIWLLLFRRPA